MISSVLKTAGKLISSAAAEGGKTLTNSSRMITAGTSVAAEFAATAARLSAVQSASITAATGQLAVQGIGGQMRGGGFNPFINGGGAGQTPQASNLNNLRLPPPVNS